MKVKDAEDVFFYFKNRLELKNKEHFYVLFLDSKNNLLNEMLISTGQLKPQTIYPIDIFKPAIISRASSIVLVHNHPSGNPTPCCKDLEITDTIRRIGDIVGIKVLDHIIIGFNCFVSF